jgi:hypothetical protein
MPKNFNLLNDEYIIYIATITEQLEELINKLIDKK